MDQCRLSAPERGLLLLTLVISLLLRLTALDAFLTPDEPVWEVRSAYFGDALLQRDWAATYQTGHPGVVTMWLGAASRRFPLLQAIVARASALLRPLASAASFPPGLGVPSATVAARGLVGLVTWLGMVALYPLMARLFDRRVALLAMGLVALDPFCLGQSRLHHLDGLLTAFVTLSVVLLTIYRLREQRLGYLLASAAMAALATANKSPGVLLLPWTGVVLFLPALRTPGYKRKQALRQGLRDMALWMLVAVAVFVAVWPAMWVDPLGTVRI
jgi:4-amino-4-deoxy-L-arabinose transferase-like glycosyltransferase